MYTSDDYNENMKTVESGKGYLRLAYEVILHATFFSQIQKSSTRYQDFLKKLNFLENSKLFSITCDLIHSENKYFNKEVFRRKCIETLVRNFESHASNSTYVRRNADRKNSDNNYIKTTD